MKQKARFLLFLFFFNFIHADDVYQSSKKELSLLMVGDALIHSRVYNDAKDKSQKYDFCKMFEPLKPLLDTDLAFYNQESILGGEELGLSSYPSFNSPKEFGECMVNLGFNLISLANNHILDKGEVGILSSLDFWKNKNVLTAGSYSSYDDRPKILTKNGITYTLLAYTYGTNGYHIPKNKNHLVNLIDKTQIQKDIKEFRPKVDLLIVALHWGDEYSFKENASQKELAQFLADEGVDIVIGTHSHVVGKIEFIKNTLVVYSLGNFISSQIGLERRIGSLVKLNVVKQDNAISLEDIRVELLYTYYNKDFKNFAIYPFSSLDEKILPNHQKIYQEFIKKILQRKIL